MVSGFGTVNAARHGPERTRVGVLAYDATVLAGTQGVRTHRRNLSTTRHAFSSGPAVDSVPCATSLVVMDGTTAALIVATTLDVGSFIRVETRPPQKSRRRRAPDLSVQRNSWAFYCAPPGTV